MVEKFEDMYNRLDTMLACDRRTDGQISCHGIVRAMHTRRAVKTSQFWQAVVSKRGLILLIFDKQNQHAIKNYMHILLSLSFHFYLLYLLLNSYNRNDETPAT